MNIKKASQYSINNMQALKNSELAACHYCKSVYKSIEIVRTIDGGKTVLCPKCEIDTVLGDNSPFDFDRATLDRLHNYWFT